MHDDYEIIQPNFRELLCGNCKLEKLYTGTRWADVPDTWTCPDCGATKEDFEMIEID